MYGLLTGGNLAKIAVIGLGYVGLTSAVGLSSLGHNVIGIDVNASKVDSLAKGVVPIYEPGMGSLMKKVVDKGNLNFSKSFDNLDSSVKFAFVCVPTPSTEEGDADLTYVRSAIETLAAKLSKGSVVVMKSTVPIGTSDSFAPSLESLGLDIASNPEFLQEGSAMFDFQNPSRIVVGARKKDVSLQVMNLYQSIEAPRLLCGLSSAETIKHASNSFLAVKLSFVNELAELCERTGANMSEVTEGMALDDRIGGKFLKPGPGWGGSCFPKDTLELAHSARSLGFEMSTVEAAISSNQRATKNVSSKVAALLERDLAEIKIAIWGLAFKANTDDMRDSPAMSVLEDLVKKGASVSAYDAIAKPINPKGYVLADSALEACRDADALLVLTESEEYKSVDPKAASALMSRDAVVFDTRRILDRVSWSEHFSSVKTLGN
jgi:UDPglucose 6-dehydrogenase